MKLPDEPRSLEAQATGGDWQVTAQVHREVDGWQSSRQVPAFTIPRWAAPTKGDAEAKAREIMNPYQEPYEITMDVWSQDGPQREAEAEPPADVSRLDPPRSMQPCWDEAAPDPGPAERQLEDWAEHNAIADGLGMEAERGE